MAEAADACSVRATLAVVAAVLNCRAIEPRNLEVSVAAVQRKEWQREERMDRRF